MKKILFTLLMTLAVLPVLFAETEEDLVPAKNAAADESGQLVNLESRRAASELDDLERRVRDLERYQRSQDDRVRNVERLVSDLRRRSN